MALFQIYSTPALSFMYCSLSNYFCIFHFQRKNFWGNFSSEKYIQYFQKLNSLIFQCNIFIHIFSTYAGIVQSVEHLLAKEDVARSSRVTRFSRKNFFIFQKNYFWQPYWLFFLLYVDLKVDIFLKKCHNSNKIIVFQNRKTLCCF